MSRSAGNINSQKRGGSDRHSVTCRLRHDEARRIAADGTGAWNSTQIDCVLARIAFAEAQRRTERATASSDKLL